LIESLCPNRAARIIDVGAGASVLVDDLLGAGYHNLTVLDIAAPALAVSRARLGARAAQVDWRVGDVTTVDLPEAAFDIWHDRAVFHFLTQEADRRRYVDQVLRAVRPGGHVIVATFGPAGPLQCSNLDVCRYAPDALHGEFGAAFKLLGHHAEAHRTPAGRDQAFVYCYCLRA
jgi:SAM-dependent methyltransferase